MVMRTNCLDCRSCLITNTENQSSSKSFEYLSTLSQGALMQPATDLTHYVSKSFAMLDLCKYITCQSDLDDRVAAENMMKFNSLPQSFLWDNQLENIRFITKTNCDVFFNNTQKLVNSQVQKEVVQQFKERQRKQRRTLSAQNLATTALSNSNSEGSTIYFLLDDFNALSILYCCTVLN